MHIPRLARIGAFILLAAVISVPFMPAGPVLAASRSYGGWNTQWQNTNEGGSFSSDQIAAWQKQQRQSSATSKAIDALDDTPVASLPMPILLGVAPANLSPNFGDPRDGGARTHEGEDIMAPLDALAVSPTDAVVISTGSGESAGNYVYTANPGGEVFAYMHFDKIADGIKPGKVLEAGDLIGYVGNTGDAAGGPTHLHFEVRKNNVATDPFPRLTGEFTLSQKMEFLGNILDDVDDADDLAQQLATAYQGTFAQASAQGIEVPKDIVKALSSLPAYSTKASVSGDLTLGSEGSDVEALQRTLIAGGYLSIQAPTGYFGALTQVAVVKYQQAHGITPASGYVGALTRASLASGAAPIVVSTTTTTSSTVPAMTTAEMKAKIAELTALLASLTAQLTSK